MLGEFSNLLPAYMLCSLFFSWLIWAYFFNGKSFKMEGDVENIFIILRIFSVLANIYNTSIVFFKSTETNQ